MPNKISPAVLFQLSWLYFAVAYLLKEHNHPIAAVSFALAAVCNGIDAIVQLREMWVTRRRTKP